MTSHCNFCLKKKVTTMVYIDFYPIHQIAQA